MVCMALHSMSFFSPNVGNTNLETSITDVGADIASRLIWLALAVLSFIIIIYRQSHALRAVRAAFPLWILLGIATASLLWSQEPGIAFIRLVQQYILIFCAIACGVGISDRSIFINNLLTAITGVVIFDLALLAAGKGWTDLGFSGFHGHKNSAGLIFAISAMLFYAAALYESGLRKKLYLAMLAVSGILLYFSDSKTSTWLSMAIIFVHFLLFLRRKQEPKRFGWYFFLGSLAAFFIITIVSFGYLYKLGITFTGRLDIWQFVFDQVSPHFFLGFGYSSFWALGESSNNILFGSNYANFITQLNQAHNSYLDVLLTLGTIGFISLWVFLNSLVQKIEKYREKYGSDVVVCSFSLISAFSLSHALLESTFFRGYNLIWMMLLLMYFFLVSRRIAQKK